MGEYYDAHDTYDGYYDQFPNTASPVLGETYIRSPGQWDEHKILITSVDDDLCIGKCITGPGKGRRALYHTTGKLIGWKYLDCRPSYRLQDIKEKI